MKTFASLAGRFGLFTLAITALAYCGTACNEAHGTESDESTSTGIEPAESSSDESTGTESTSTGTESSSDSGESSSTGEPMACEPGSGGMFGECYNSCDCETGLTCRPNYPGGYLAECTAECTDDTECGAGVCSAGWCILPCGAMGECAEETWCYPGTHMDGTPVIDPFHPVRHCMPHVAEG